MRFLSVVRCLPEAPPRRIAIFAPWLTKTAWSDHEPDFDTSPDFKPRTETAGRVGITETRARAGSLLEQGAAFMQLEADALQGSGQARRHPATKSGQRSGKSISMSSSSAPASMVCPSAITSPARA